MRATLLIAISLILSGCAMSPSADGTWTGKLKPVAMYARDGQTYDALVLDVASGPEAKSASLPNERSGEQPTAVLVDRSGRLLPMKQFMEGQTVRVSGSMGVGKPLAPNGQGIERHSPDVALWIIRVSGGPDLIATLTRVMKG